MPELDWFSHSFAQRNRGCFGSVHCDIAPQQHCVQESFWWEVIGSNLNRQKTQSTVTTMQALMLPRCSRQGTLRLCVCSPRNLHGCFHTLRCSQSAEVTWLSTRSQRKIPMTNGRNRRSATADSRHTFGLANWLRHAPTKCWWCSDWQTCMTRCAPTNDSHPALNQCDSKANSAWNSDYDNQFLLRNRAQMQHNLLPPTIP